MKVRVLYPSAFQFLEGKVPEAGDVITIDEANGAALVRAGSAEVVPTRTKTERATKAPGEAKRPARRTGKA